MILAIGIFPVFRRFPGSGFFLVSRFLSPGFSSLGFGIFFSLGIFIPGIRDFLKFRDLNPRVLGFLSLGFGIYRGFLFVVFFVGWIRKKPSLVSMTSLSSNDLKLERLVNARIYFKLKILRHSIPT